MRFVEWKKKDEERRQREQYETVRQLQEQQQQQQTNDGPNGKDSMIKQEPVPTSTMAAIDGSTQQKEQPISIQNNNNDPEEEPLLPPWIPMHPRSSPDETYYYNPETGESTWDRPTASNITEGHGQQQEENNLAREEEHYDEDKCTNLYYGYCATTTN